MRDDSTTMEPRIDFKAHAEIAWQLTLKHVFSLVLLTLVTATVSVLSLGIFAPAAMAGHFYAMLRLVREGREPRLQDVFSQIGLTLPLLMFTLFSALLVTLGYALLVVPGIAIGLAITFFSIYMVPLMTDEALSLGDAIRESYRMATTGGAMDNVLVVIVVVGMWGIGSSVFIGWLFTQPLAGIFLASVYQQKVTGDAPA